MNTQRNINFNNQVSRKETDDVVRLIVSLLIIGPKENSNEVLTNKGIFVSFFSDALEEVMHNAILKSKQDRLKIIKFIDKLKQQQFAIELAKGDKANLQIAAERLGRKAQSSFSSAK